MEKNKNKQSFILIIKVFLVKIVFYKDYKANFLYPRRSFLQKSILPATFSLSKKIRTQRPLHGHSSHYHRHFHSAAGSLPDRRHRFAFLAEPYFNPVLLLPRHDPCFVAGGEKQRLKQKKRPLKSGSPLFSNAFTLNRLWVRRSCFDDMPL